MPVIATLTSEALTTPPLRLRPVVLPRARGVIYPADDVSTPWAELPSRPRRTLTTNLSI